MVARWELGEGLPRRDTLGRVAAALGVSPAWLAFGLGPEDGGGTSDGLADRVRAARLALGLSRREIARRAALTEGVIRLVEGGSSPALDTLEALAKALGVSPAWLAFGG